MRNVMCLFNIKGEGACAYVYPFRLNDNPGELYNDWADNPDIALYFALELDMF